MVAQSALEVRLIDLETMHSYMSLSDGSRPHSQICTSICMYIYIYRLIYYVILMLILCYQHIMLCVVMLCSIMVSAKAFALLSRRFCVVLGLIWIRVAGG